MQMHLDDFDRALHEFEYDLWSGTRMGLRWQCALKGLPTNNGQLPDYCGGSPAHERRSHSIPANMIKAVNGGSPFVVGFSLKSRIKLREWKLGNSSDLVR